MLLVCAMIAQRAHSDFGRDLDSAVRSGELHVTKTTDLQREQAGALLCVSFFAWLYLFCAAYIDDSQALHRMENANATMPAVSLHIYSPPFHQCRVFDEHSLIGREVSIGCANAAKNPFVHTDMRASSEPSFGGHLQLPPASPEPLLPPPTSVPELVAQLRNVFRASPLRSARAAHRRPRRRRHALHRRAAVARRACVSAGVHCQAGGRRVERVCALFRAPLPAHSVGV